MPFSKPNVNGQEAMAKEGLLDMVLLGVVRASGGGKPWVAAVRPVQSTEVDSMRNEVEVRGTLSAQCDFVLESGCNDGQNPVLVLMAKVDGSPVGFFAFRQAFSDENGHLRKSVELVKWQDCRVLVGSVNIVSDYGPLLSGRERRILAGLTDGQDAIGSKLLCLWLSFGRRRVLGGESFYQFLKQVVAFAPRRWLLREWRVVAGILEGQRG